MGTVGDGDAGGGDIAGQAAARCDLDPLGGVGVTGDLSRDDDRLGEQVSLRLVAGISLSIVGMWLVV